MTDYTGGNGDHSYTITSADGSSRVTDTGTTGTDSLTVDWSDLNGWGHLGAIRNNNGNIYGSVKDVLGSPLVVFSGIELLTIAFGDRGSRFIVEHHYANLIGGAGSDKLMGNFSNSTNDISFVLDHTPGAASVFNGQGTSITDFENIEITAGSGDDDLTGGDFNDTLIGGAGVNRLNGGGGSDWIISGSGIDTIDGGDGNDLWNGNFSSTTSSLTFRQGQNYSATLSNGTSFTSIEDMQLRTGSGDDVVYYDRNGFIDAGNGYDRITCDFSDSDQAFDVEFDDYGIAISQFGPYCDLGFTNFEMLTVTLPRATSRSPCRQRPLHSVNEPRWPMAAAARTASPAISPIPMQTSTSCLTRLSALPPL